MKRKRLIHTLGRGSDHAIFLICSSDFALAKFKQTASVAPSFKICLSFVLTPFVKFENITLKIAIVI